MMRYAENAPYWKPNTTIGKTRTDIHDLLAKYGCDDYMEGRQSGKPVLAFRFEGQNYRFVLNPLPSKHDKPADRVPGFEKRAELQAWRAMFHHLKASLEMAYWVGSVRAALLPHKVLPGGKTVGELTDTELTLAALPAPTIEEVT